MPSVLTTFREAVRAELATDLGIRIQAGRITGPVRERVGCVFPGSRSERDEDVSQADVELRVRIFQPHDPQRERTVPLDPALLEADAQAVIDSLKDKQFDELGAPDVWFLRVVAEEYDLEDEHVVELTIRAWTDNPFNPA